jgi:hypothetical protein
MIAAEVTMPAIRLRQVAPASALLFVLGFFGLAARGSGVSPDGAVYLVILVGAAALAGMVLALTALFAAVETASGRAWALGFRRLAPGESGIRGVAVRALRYATFLWLCNGAAFFVAGLR